MRSRAGLAVGYVVSGGTAGTGLAAQKAEETYEAIMVMGLPLSEIALILGIIGTITTILLQILSYRRMCKKDKNDHG